MAARPKKGKPRRVRTRTVNLTLEQLKALAEARLEGVIDAIEVFNVTCRGHVEALGVVQAAREYLEVKELLRTRKGPKKGRRK